MAAAEEKKVEFIPCQRIDGKTGNIGGEHAEIKKYMPPTIHVLSWNAEWLLDWENKDHVEWLKLKQTGGYPEEVLNNQQAIVGTFDGWLDQEDENEGKYGGLDQQDRKRQIMAILKR